MIEEFFRYRALLQYAIIFGTTAWAFARGDSPEKIIGTILSACVVVFLLFNIFLKGQVSYNGIILPYLAIDLAVFIALVPIAMRANRIYPLWILAAQLIMLIMHFQRLLPAIDPLGYFVLTHGPSWVQAFAFMAGVALHVRRQHRFGPYRSWRTQLRRS